MPTDLLIHATGLVALALNVIALARTCERSLRLQSGFAGARWPPSALGGGAASTAAGPLDRGPRRAGRARGPPGRAGPARRGRPRPADRGKRATAARGTMAPMNTPAPTSSLPDAVDRLAA